MAQVSNNIQDVSADIITNYKSLTHELNNYNEIYNLNNYLAQNTTTEFDRLSKMNEVFKSKVLKSKQQYLDADRNVNRLELTNYLLCFSAVIFGFFFVAVGIHLKSPAKFSKKSVWIVVLILTVLYIALVLLIVLSNSKRRNQYWDQYYWQQIQQVSTK